MIPKMARMVTKSSVVIIPFGSFTAPLQDQSKRRFLLTLPLLQHKLERILLALQSVTKGLSCEPCLRSSRPALDGRTRLGLEYPQDHSQASNDGQENQDCPHRIELLRQSRRGYRTALKRGCEP